LKVILVHARLPSTTVVTVEVAVVVAVVVIDVLSQLRKLPSSMPFLARVSFFASVLHTT